MTTAMNRLSDGIWSFADWWLDQLISCVPKSLMLKASRQSYLIVTPQSDGKYRFDLVRKGETLSVGRSHLEDASHALAGIDLRKTRTILRLPSSVVLVKSIDLPPPARRDLRRAVGYQIANISPFTKDEVYFGFCVTERAGSNSQLKIRTCITPTELADGHLAALKARNFQVERIESENDHIELENDSVRLLLEDRASRWDRALRRVLWPVGLILIIAFPVLLTRDLSAQQGSLRAANAALQGEIKQGNQLEKEIRELAARKGYLHKKKIQDVTVSRILLSLAEILPEASWLSMVTLRGEQVTINGFARDGARLIQAIEASKSFREARFSSPIVREAKESIERFEITVTATPQKGLP